MNKRIKQKKAQEEMVGFILIIILVAVIAVIFLGISLRKRADVEQESIELSNLLEAIEQYTTSCKVGYIYSTIQDLSKDCYVGERCEDSRNSCEALESELKEILSKTILIGENWPTKSYKISIFQEYNDNIQSILEISEGEEECSGQIFESEHFVYSYSGNIITRLNVCREVESK